MTPHAHLPETLVLDEEQLRAMRALLIERAKQVASDTQGQVQQLLAQEWSEGVLAHAGGP
jgi:hypothetical protein